MKGTRDPRTCCIATFALCASPISAPSASRSAHRGLRSHRSAQPARIWHPRQCCGTMANLNVRSIVGYPVRDRKNTLATNVPKRLAPKIRWCNPISICRPASTSTRGSAASFFSQTATAEIARVLGSALAHFAGRFANSATSRKRNPHFPQSTALGHAGALVIGKWEQFPLPDAGPRPIFNEGYSARGGLIPSLFSLACVQAVILTHAAGGINGNPCRPLWC